VAAALELPNTIGATFELLNDGLPIREALLAL
jgi:hypothetical protein